MPLSTTPSAPATAAFQGLRFELPAPALLAALGGLGLQGLLLFLGGLHLGLSYARQSPTDHDVSRSGASELAAGPALLPLPVSSSLTAEEGTKLHRPMLETALDDPELDTSVNEGAVSPSARAGVVKPNHASHRVPEAGDTQHRFLRQLLRRTALRHGLEPRLLWAVAQAESSFDPLARSAKGARGLMQLMPQTAMRFGVGAEELDDPARNAEAGARYLAWLHMRFDGDLERVLAAYNAGEGAVDRYRGVPPYAETRRYLRKVRRLLGADSELKQGAIRSPVWENDALQSQPTSKAASARRRR